MRLLYHIFSAFGRRTFHPRPQDGVFRCDLNKVKGERIAVFMVPTLYPKAAFYHRVKNEGRLISDRWWLLKDPEDFAPYFTPKKVSGEALREAWKRARKEFYSFPSIWKRFH